MYKKDESTLILQGIRVYMYMKKRGSTQVQLIIQKTYGMLAFSAKEWDADVGMYRMQLKQMGLFHRVLATRFKEHYSCTRGSLRKVHLTDAWGEVVALGGTRQAWTHWSLEE